MKETNSTTSTLATRPVAAVPAQRIQPAPSRLAGAEPEDVNLPRLHIFQNQSKERQMYGERKEGELFNVVTGETIAQRAELPLKKFVVLFGFVCYIKATKEGIIYIKRNKAEVPPEDLRWNENETDPAKRKPAAMRYINWVVVFEGTIDPVVLSFKSTSLKTGQAIETMERSRAFAATLKKDGNGRASVGFYALSLRPETRNGNTWLHPQVRPMGDATPEMQDLAEMMMNSFNPDRVTTDFVDADVEPNGGDENGGGRNAAPGREPFNPNADEPAF